MPNRRQFLLAGSALGLPLASVLPLPAVGSHALRLGLVQVRQPFVDQHDAKGSRERAFSALKAQLRRSLDDHGSLDWLATSAFPLSEPLVRERIEDFSLTGDSDELCWLRRFANQHAVRVSLSAWYRHDDHEAEPAWLDIGADGWAVRRELAAGHRAAEHRGLALDNELRPGRDTALAEHCRRMRLYGAGIAACRGPTLPPGAPAAHYSTTRVVDPTGRVRAQLPPGEPGCLVISL